MFVSLGVGMDSILFGMTVSEIVGLLGQPDKINLTERENSTVYYYNQLMTKLYFSEFNYKLKVYSIEVFNNSIEIFGRNVKSLSKMDIEYLLHQNKIHSFQYREYESLESIFCEEIMCSFVFRFDQLISVEFSALWKKEENARAWPVQNIKSHDLDEIFRLQIGEGVGEIKFGMTATDILEVYGVPDKIYRIDLIDSLVYEYNSKKIQFSFLTEEGDDLGKLFKIRTYNYYSKLFGTTIIQKSKQNIQYLMKKHGHIECKHEDYETFDIIGYDKIQCWFYFQFDQLYSFEFGPLWANENDYIWPNIV